MRTWTADSRAPAAIAWALMARPGVWASWAPHVRGAWGLGTPEVEAGAVGAARLFGVLPVPAKITAKSARSWTWQVGPAEMVHRVEERGTGCVVAIDLRAPGPLEPALAATYGPIIQVMLNRLARVAE
ncbi:SRPBCC family protein [Solirubrobacter sp. CPCC 204708]|uniref:SRPBCC family protein n=1 Tax=Solirubrobacter deserti TaxID=2282478 RepID=A0ABT4RK81_9ACTN|nr:SRPBCC family protein [Solirubrobacter deserti]MBE2316824.1 SRPBCC family protein [Solirubrobacter deserti]MDA0138959.1 SRPBCC family protein [Solirubrobacter deserti]